MKKLMKKDNKGFTLVELIVVLVILAILAAILVPALLGYIDKAKKEKDYQAAQEVHTAVQAVASEAYGLNEKAADYVTVDTVLDLAGITKGSNRGQCSAIAVKYVDSDTTATEKTDYQVSTVTVTIDGNNYHYNGSNWSTADNPVGDGETALK